MKKRILVTSIFICILFIISNGLVTIASAETETKSSDVIEEVEKDVSDVEKSPASKTEESSKVEEKKIEEPLNKEDKPVDKKSITLAQFEDSVIVSLKRNSPIDIPGFLATVKGNIVGTLQAPSDLKNESDIVLLKLLNDRELTTKKAGIYTVTAIFETKENKYSVPFKYEVLFEKATLKLALINIDTVNKVLKFQTEPNCSVGIPDGREENVVADQTGVATVHYDKWQQATKDSDIIQFKACGKNGEYSELLAIKTADLFPKETVNKPKNNTTESKKKGNDVVLPKTGEQKSMLLVIIGASIIIIIVVVVFIKKRSNKS